MWDSNPDILAIRNALDKLVRIIGMQWREKRKTKKEKSLDLSDEFFEGLSPVEKEAIIKVKNTLLVNSPDVDDITTIKSVLENMRVLFQFESFQDYVTKIKPEDITVENVEKITNDWEYLESKELAKVALGRISLDIRFADYYF